MSEAVTLHRQGHLDDAEKIYNRVLKLQRDNFDALHLLGLLNHQRGKAGEAYRLITAALKVNPRSPEALSNLAMVLHALKRYAEALASLDKALALDPGNLGAIGNRGNVLSDLGRPAEAIAAFDAVLTREPRHVPSLVSRGNARAALGGAEQALADYDAALRLAPGHPIALFNQGNALRLLGRDDEALAAYDRALAALPSHPGAWLNRGLSLAALNRHREAIESYERVLALVPDHADARFNAALSRLTLGDYRRGFQDYEWRWRRAGMAARKDLRGAPRLGEAPVSGRTLLLHAEQGLGDTVQFARYAPQLAREGARLVLEVQPELKELMAGLQGIASVVSRGEPLPAFDLHCPLASLPLACKTELETVPAEIPYLHASPARIERWRARLDALPRPLVAVAWSGRMSHVNDRNRSIPLETLEPVLGFPGIKFVSLQRDLRAADAERLSHDSRIVHIGEELGDFADTAAVLALADLVVSVDTSVAHVAGAMGRPTIVLLPYQPDWRWTLDRESSPWYPDLKLLRQTRPGDWGGVIDRLCGALSAAFPAP